MSNDASVPLVLALDDASATLEQVGGKGASLARLASAGLPVPPGFHITTAAYRRFVEEHELQEQILTAVAEVTVNQPATLEEASRQIAKLFASYVMPDTIADTVRQAYAELGEQELPVAVRSSATAEDLPEMSFAGQQETFLNMRGEAMVLDAVKRCWASLWTARAIGYRARNNIAPQDVSLAVVVQQLVLADASGILFTANPVSGERNQILINAAWGLGEAIVGGQVTPDTIVVDKTTMTIIEEQINEKDVMTVRTLEGTHEEAVPDDKRKQAALNTAQAIELAHLAVQIEQLYGQPMDIEWVLQNGHIFIVQARPITSLPEPTSKSQALRDTQAEEWQLPNPKGRYMRSSVLELLPDPLSPLFTTLGLPAWDKALRAIMNMPGVGETFSRLIRDAFSIMHLVTINGYGYYDLTMTPVQSLKMALALPPIFAVFPRLLASSEQRWRKARSSYAEMVNHWQTIDLTTQSAEALLNGVRIIVTEAAQYYLSIQSGILPAAYMSEGLFTIAYNRFFKSGDAPTALTFMLGFDSSPIQAEKSLYDLAQWVRKQPELATALANISSQQFTSAYHEWVAQKTATEDAWSAFWQRLAHHLERFGHTIYDLDFAKPMLTDDPMPALETLKFFLSEQAPNPYTRQAQAEQAREQAMQTTLARLHGLRRTWFRRLLKWAQNLAPLREDGLSDIGLGWPILRQMLHEIGQRLVASNAINMPDDVFWLTIDELQEAVTALDTEHISADYHEIVAERRAAWDKQHMLTPPSALPLKEGARFLGIDFSSMMPARLDQPEGDVLKGIAASPGHVTGSARVIHGPNEFDQMRPGDILVARITTPAWTPLFALASGIVTDVGGPLSHSSIVAREYHIPAVLGTGVATERLSSGQRITVDGDAGIVRNG